MASLRPVYLGICIALLLACAALIVTSTSRPAGSGCGPTSLYVLSRHLGARQSYAAVCRRFDQIDSVNFDQIRRAAQQCGINMMGRWYSIAGVCREHPLGIIHVDREHFVAILGYGRNGVQVADPIESGRALTVLWSYAKLAAKWDGRMLVVLPNPSQRRSAGYAR